MNHVPMSLRAVLVSLTLVAAPTVAFAQARPLSDHHRHMYAGIKVLLVRSAEKMPETEYSFKPTPAVRSFGQIIGHVADAQYRYCAMVLGEKMPTPMNEKNKTSKADLIAGLHEALAYCDRAYDSMTDAVGAELLKLGPMEMPKLGMLNVNVIHSTEHYGNLVTYLRMKEIVPPSSEPNFYVPMPPRN